LAHPVDLTRTREQRADVGRDDVPGPIGSELLTCLTDAIDESALPPIIDLTVGQDTVDEARHTVLEQTELATTPINVLRRPS